MVLIGGNLTYHSILLYLHTEHLGVMEILSLQWTDTDYD